MDRGWALLKSEEGRVAVALSYRSPAQPLLLQATPPLPQSLCEPHCWVMLAQQGLLDPAVSCPVSVSVGLWGPMPGR